MRPRVATVQRPDPPAVAVAVEPRNQDVLRVAAAILGALWVSHPFKAGPAWETRCDLALEEAEKLVASYDRRARKP